MGSISAAEREAALQEELVISRRNPAGVLSYYRDWIDPLLNDVIGQQRDDFVIETTIDIAAQRAGDEAINSVLGEQGELAYEVCGFDFVAGYGELGSGLAECHHLHWWSCAKEREQS